jgi:hypothetical protein
MAVWGFSSAVCSVAYIIWTKFLFHQCTHIISYIIDKKGKRKNKSEAEKRNIAYRCMTPEAIVVMFGLHTTHVLLLSVSTKMTLLLNPRAVVNHAFAWQLQLQCSYSCSYKMVYFSKTMTLLLYNQASASIACLPACHQPTVYPSSYLLWPDHHAAHGKWCTSHWHHNWGSGICTPPAETERLACGKSNSSERAGLISVT